jgi:hypothetical protein
VTPEEYERVSEKYGRIDAEIFKLREQVAFQLQANNVDAANRLLALISWLESTRPKKS